MHPADVVAALRSGASLVGTDWKYGWPHKFYVTDVPNPHPDVMVLSSYSSGGAHRCVLDSEGRPLPIRDVRFTPAGPLLRSKWYNEHILDAGFDVEARDALLRLIQERSGVVFQLEAGRLRYAAPHFNYQR